MPRYPLCAAIVVLVLAACSWLDGVPLTFGDWTVWDWCATALMTLAFARWWQVEQEIA